MQNSHEKKTQETKETRGRMKRSIVWLQGSRWRYLIGGFFVFIGAILFLLPIGPGSLIILFGLYLINSQWAHGKLEKSKERMRKIINSWKKVVFRKKKKKNIKKKDE